MNIFDELAEIWETIEAVTYVAYEEWRALDDSLAATTYETDIRLGLYSFSVGVELVELEGGERYSFPIERIKARLETFDG